MAQQYKDLLLSRFALFNLACLAALCGSFFMHWPQMIVEADASRITWVIAGLFLWGWFKCLGRMIHLNAEVNLCSENRGWFLG